MNIYFGHPSGFEFRNKFYEPFSESDLFDEHDLVFQHDSSDEQCKSKKFLRDECDLFVAEVSRPSTGGG
ncbi:MAG: hypothetical protein ABEJ99_01585 [Candidatus Nanohaloarchaea archaeon]